MLSFPRTIQLLSLGCILACLPMATGCSTMNSLANKSVPVMDSAPPAGQFRVEMNSTFGKPKSFVGAVQGNVTVQDALEQSGATKKYRAMDVEVLRVVDTADTGARGLRMKVNYRTRDNMVMPEQNYALLDGDRIIVNPLSEGAMSKIASMLDNE